MTNRVRDTILNLSAVAMTLPQEDAAKLWDAIYLIEDMEEAIAVARKEGIRLGQAAVMRAGAVG